MNEYVRQFYYEGIGNIFFAKPKKILDKKVKNKIVNKIFTIMLKIMYTIFAISCGIVLFYIAYPF